MAIEQLGILPALYTTIVIPEGVAEELRRMKNRPIEVEKLLANDWVQIKEVQDRETLDKGESEAITLALELAADLILMDETAGRQIAHAKGLNVTGLLGVLIEAKQKKQIPNVKEILDRLRVDAGFWLSESLYQKVLKSVDEL